MHIYDQIKELLAPRKNKLVFSNEIKWALQTKYGTNPGSIMLSDYCYNRYNEGIAFTHHLFEYVTRSTYKYLGEHYPYTGYVYQKRRGSDEERVVGEWRNGVKVLYDDAGPVEGETAAVSQDQMEDLYQEYIRMLRYEIGVLQCKPTELRHLLGRIGELHCAMNTNGRLAKCANQHGFDVISNGRRISVKTTAQGADGFISFNMNTFDRFEDVYVVQFIQDDFKVIYYGPKDSIQDISRVSGNTYETDIAKIKALSAMAIHSD